MMDRTQHGALLLLEELDLLHKARNPPPEATSRRNVFRNWKWKVLDFLDDIRRRGSRCVVCLQVHQVGGLPSAMDGQVLVVGWKTKGCKGEHTLPVHVRQGVASFDEIFLHYCGTDVRSILRNFTIWVSLVDAADCDLGTFHVDLSELAMVENLNSNFGGKSMSFILGGMASGGALNLSVYCRMLEEAQDIVGQKQNKSKFFACLPDLGCLRSRSVTVSARRIPSLRSERGFITIENSMEECLPTDEEDGGFITIEKGTVCALSRRPPSDHLANTDDESGGLEDEKPCLVMELNDEFDVQKVEDEFLRMLEEKYWKGKDHGEVWKRRVEGNLSLSLDLDLELLIKEAEMELTKAAQLWKSRAGATLLEKEDFFSSSSSEQAASSSSNSNSKKRSLGRRVFQIALISVTGGLALSALNDLAIFHGCTSKAIEKASQNQKIIETLGVPIVRGPWYDASLAVGHKRHSVSCTFPVSGPQGSGIFQLKAIRVGEDTTFSFLRHHNWDILIMEALLHVPSNDEKHQTLRISLTNDFPLSSPVECQDCRSPESETPENSPWRSSAPPIPPLSLHEFLLSYSASSSSFSKPAFIDAATGATLTYADLRALVAAAARALAALGVRRGDVVLLVSPNSLHIPALVLAVVSLGAVLSTANFLYTRREIQSQVQDCNPVLILTTVDLAPKLDGLLPRPLTFIERFLESLSVDRTAAIEFAGVGQADTAVLMYSSGTTGKSKGVVSSHGNLVAMAAVLRHVWGREEVYAGVLPLFHVYGFSVLVCGAVAAGATVVVLRRFAVEELLKAVEKYRVTRLPAVPPMVVQLARSSGVARGYDLGSLKEVISSGAPLAREHMERFADGYPAIKLAQCYGLTETSGPITVCDGLEGGFQISIGRLIPTMEAKIVDVPTGKALPPNEHGELYVRGHPVMQGYLNNQEATSLAIDGEGWLHTGDMCYIDRQGLIYVVERIKEFIKYKAYQVAPAELEEVLSAHPDILDVAVTS
ncbi:putative 4-coumarate--CoA ligase-like 5 [Cocos nucifera]|uniref:4-coumarate--CoA ligase n=1 Tax=Cocos nucifera TaxID=13894 RepID=A0A8K0N881_COCNU|nr:putative 4-coumarate--CoA ligase-like 5 [Cocos nucifera]